MSKSASFIINENLPPSTLFLILFSTNTFSFLLVLGFVSYRNIDKEPSKLNFCLWKKILS